jgi:hypothetical protein
MRGRIAAQLVLAVLASGCGGLTVQEYTSTEGRYRVQFAGTPKHQEKIVPTPVGPVTAKFAIGEEWSGTGRSVMYVDYPPNLFGPGSVNAGLEGACQGMIAEGQLTALSKKTISLNGHPGREVSFDSQPGRPGPKLHGRARLYLVGNRLYQVLIAGRSGVIQSETIDGFLNSFSLLDQGPRAAETRVAGGPPAVTLPTPPAGPPSAPLPGPGPTRRPHPAPAPPLRARHPRISGPPTRPNPPASATGSTAALGFYNIPEPASAVIEADIPGMGSTPPDRPPGGITVRGSEGPGPLADVRPSPPANASPSPLLIPARPGPGPVATPGPQPRQDSQPEVDSAPPARQEPRDGESHEVPAFLTPTSAGATIVSFDWVDQNDDYAGTDGRQIGPGGGKDEHYRLVMDLPPASIIEEVAITGGGVLHWTTKPLPRSWPVAVVANQELKNRRQMLRLGAFSGRWTFDLYAESHETVRPGQDFGVEVIIFIRSARHHLTARCQRK